MAKKTPEAIGTCKHLLRTMAQDSTFLHNALHGTVPVVRPVIMELCVHPIFTTPRWPTEAIIIMLNDMFTAFDALCEQFGVYKVGRQDR
jgi:hypothetical protein